DRLPPLPYALRRPRLGVAEDVRMPPDELGVHRACDGLEIALALLLEQQRQEVHLEEQIAELVEELSRLLGRCRVGDLVRLVGRVRDDRPRGLLSVPRAIASEPARQLLELDERLRKGHVTELWSCSSGWSRAARSPPRTSPCPCTCSPSSSPTR